jgi:hypothetical protein
MGEIRNSYKILVRNLNGTQNLGHPGIDGRIILKWVLKKRGLSMWTG